jgi:iron complex transport system permease protein
MVVGEDQRYFLPASAAAGAIILSVASTLSKGITPGVIYPIGIITALVGVPFFLSLILSIRTETWK